MKINVAVDSGAFSIFTKYSQDKGTGGIWKKDDFSFYKTEKFAKYLAEYMAWIKKHGKAYDYCVSLDVIRDPDMSYGIWREMCQECKPFVPIPVVHNGEDPKWLRKYLAKTDYIGLGGMGGGDVTYKSYFNWLRSVFKLVPRNVRMHGFAVTQHQAMRDYPWHSVDSATPFWAASHGQAIVVNGTKAIQVNFGRSYSSPAHFNRLGESYRRLITDSLERFGLTVDQLMGQNYGPRAFLNYYQILRLAEPQGIKYYLSGSVSGGYTSMVTLMVLLERELKLKYFYYLGTFFEPNTMKKVKGYEDTKHEHLSVSLDKLPKSALSSATLKGLHSRPDPFLFHKRPRVRIR